ncbi:MAG: D-alanyl-D-alanine carboxypeptidase family protein [bacterium]
MTVTFARRDRTPNRRNRRRRPGRSPRSPRAALVAVVAIVGAATLAWRVAASGPGARPSAPPPTVVRCLLRPVSIPSLSCTSAILVEAETGTVLYQKNADERRAPASLAKMMTELVLLEDVAAGKLRLDEEIEVSANASTMGGSQVFLKHGEKQPAEALLHALGIASANDAAMALAEHVAGSEKAFVARMNARAKELGCRQTKFVNVHGLDLPRQDKNWTSARDLALIAGALVRHPKALEISSTWREPFRGGEFWLDNTNKSLKRFEGMDGLKTGWTPRAGGCFVGTASRDGVRLIAVILDSKPGRDRFDVAMKLLAAGFAPRPQWQEAVRVGAPVAAIEPAGEAVASKSPTTAGGTVRVLIEESREDALVARYRPRGEDTPADVAPEVAGWVDLRLGDKTVATVPARPGR